VISKKIYLFAGLTQKSPKSFSYRRHAAASRRVPPRRQERQGFVDYA